MSDVTNALNSLKNEIKPAKKQFHNKYNKNSYHTPLGANEVFTGIWETSHYDHVGFNLHTDVSGVFHIQFSIDGETVVEDKTYTITGEGVVSDAMVNYAGRYVRVVYENGVTPQSKFNLNTFYGDNLFPLSTRLGTPIHDNISVQHVRAILAGKTVSGSYVDLTFSEEGSLIMADQGSDTAPQNNIYQFLDSVGDNTGTKNANLDYSGGGSIRITAPAGKEYVLHRVLVSIRDAGTMSAGEYGNVPELSNGIELKMYDSDNTTVLSDITSGVPVKCNAHWGAHCYDVKFIDQASGDNFIAVRWTFSKSGSPIRLKPGQSLVAEFNDNLTGLKEHYYQVHGYSIDI